MLRTSEAPASGSMSIHFHANTTSRHVEVGGWRRTLCWGAEAFSAMMCMAV